jgi:lantibiotic modifying enzyme
MTVAPPPEPAWRALLDGEDAAGALDAAGAVGEALADLPPPTPSSGDSARASELAVPSVSGGEAGYALFFAYLDAARPDHGFAEKSLLHLERAIDLLASGEALADLYSGFTGVAWTVEHLRERLDGGEDLNEEIDEALRDHLGSAPWRRQFDLTSGLAGYGLYALARLPKPAAEELLELVVDRLAETAVERDGTLTWHSSPEDIGPEARQRYPQGHENLGVAHGVPGVIAVLARTVGSGVAVAKARSLLDGAVRWTLAQKLAPGSDSVFPYAVAPGIEPQAARAAWCYGDPGVAAALLVAAHAAGESAWEAEALDLARTAARRPAETAGVRDACLCHGAAGLGHLYNRFYQATGEALFRDAAVAWFRHALGLRRPGQGCAGFLTWGPEATGEMGWIAEPSFLTGAAGIALALLAAATPQEPRWDELLLVSPAPIGRRSEGRISPLPARSDSC